MLIFLITIEACVSFVVLLKFSRPRERDGSINRMIESDQIREALNEFIGEKSEYRVKRYWKADRFSYTFTGQVQRHKNTQMRPPVGLIRNVDLYVIPEDVAYTRLAHAVIWEREKGRNLQLRDITFLDGGAGECRSAAFTNDGIIPLGLTSPKYEDDFIQNVLKNPFDEQFRRGTKNRLLRFNKETFRSYQNSSEYIYVVHVNQSLSLQMYMKLDRYHMDKITAVTRLVNIKFRPTEVSPRYPLYRPSAVPCVTNKTCPYNATTNGTEDSTRASTSAPCVTNMTCPDLNTTANCTEDSTRASPPGIPDYLAMVRISSSHTGDVSIEVNTAATIKCYVQYHRSLYDKIDVKWFRDQKPIDLQSMSHQLVVDKTKYNVTYLATSALKIGPVTCDGHKTTYWCAFNLTRTNSSVIETYNTSTAMMALSLTDIPKIPPKVSFKPVVPSPGGWVDFTCTGLVGIRPRNIRMTIQNTVSGGNAVHLTIKQRTNKQDPYKPCSTIQTVVTSYMFEGNLTDYNVTCEIIGGGENTIVTAEFTKLIPCKHGMFAAGGKCRGICHCQNESQCRRTDGECMDGVCSTGYEGPSCQEAQSAVIGNSPEIGIGVSGLFSVIIIVVGILFVKKKADRLAIYTTRKSDPSENAKDKTDDKSKGGSNIDKPTMSRQTTSDQATTPNQVTTPNQATLPNLEYESEFNTETRRISSRGSHSRVETHRKSSRTTRSRKSSRVTEKSYKMDDDDNDKSGIVRKPSHQSKDLCTANEDASPASQKSPASRKSVKSKKSRASNIDSAI